jgi:alpha-L-rhamnosidase
VLSPGYKLVELTPPITDPSLITLTATDTTTFTIETLTQTITTLGGFVSLDGLALHWEDAGPRRPDVILASRQIQSGEHRIEFFGMPSDGVTFNLSTSKIDTKSLPFSQGTHAGRRQLLAQPVDSPEQVKVISQSGQLSLEFNSLPGYAVLDLGRTIHGRLRLIASGAAGTILDIGWDERLFNGTLRPLPYPGTLHPQWNQVDSWILDGNAREIITLDARSGRYILITAWGQAPLSMSNLQVFEEHYPLTQTGEFHSSDPLLNQIWQMGVDTLRPNMTDSYTDTPWRERGQWWGDVFVEDQINKVAFGDTALLYRGLMYIADAFHDTDSPGMAPNNNGLHMIDYAMLWVQKLAEYHRITGDTAFLIQIYPTLQAFMNGLESHQNIQTGLLDLPKQHWSLTAYIDTNAFSSRYGQSTALNALYYQTLLSAASIAQALGDNSQANAWSQKAASVREKMNELLYEPVQHRYMANIYQGTASAPSPHAQAWALSAGITPSGETERLCTSLLEFLSADPASPKVWPYGMYWVLDALGRCNHVPEAIQLIKTFYGLMIDNGATTWWEGFNSNLAYSSSLSHGWSGSPTWFLTTYLLGARRTGANTWELEPAFSGAAHAEGQLPLAQGALSASWEIGACSKYVTVSAPPGSSGRIILSGDPNALVYLNGTFLGRLDHFTGSMGSNNKKSSIQLNGGDYSLEIRQVCTD